MKKTLLVILFVIISILLLMNYRVPFVRKNTGIWSIGYGTNKHFPEAINVEKGKLYSINTLQKIIPNSEFLADPFFCKEGDRYFIFFELKKYSQNHASIAILESKDGKNYQYKGIVLKENFHLSYPQVFKFKNNFYMLPETQGAKNVILYKAKKFPYEWERCDTLLKNIKLKDPSIFVSDSLNIMVGTDEKLTMVMYHSDSLFGTWKKHPRHTVIMGVESRAGGRFIPYKDGLLLPIQNGSEGYGTALSLYKFNFKNRDYSIRREKEYYLQAQKNIKEFNGGMHHLDLQKIDNQYYYVYDGKKIINNETSFAIKSSLKINYFDLKNWWYQKTN
jgi:hypothetical protein